MKLLRSHCGYERELLDALTPAARRARPRARRSRTRPVAHGSLKARRRPRQPAPLPEAAARDAALTRLRCGSRRPHGRAVALAYNSRRAATEPARNNDMPGTIPAARQHLIAAIARQVALARARAAAARARSCRPTTAASTNPTCATATPPSLAAAAAGHLRFGAVRKPGPGAGARLQPRPSRTTAGSRRARWSRSSPTTCRSWSIRSRWC